MLPLSTNVIVRTPQPCYKDKENKLCDMTSDRKEAEYLIGHLKMMTDNVKKFLLN